MGKGVRSRNYRDYVIRDGKFIGAFEEMYRHISDPWHIGAAQDLQYDAILMLLHHSRICESECEILDLGCGKGAFTARIQKFRPDARVLAVDISPTAVRKAKKEYGHLGIEFRVMDVPDDLPGLDRRFDLILMSQMVWYILPRFQEITRMIFSSLLREGGFLIINQTFYKPEEQTYGRDIISTVEDLLRLLGREPVALLETNRFTNHNAIILLRN